MDSIFSGLNGLHTSCAIVVRRYGVFTPVAGNALRFYFRTGWAVHRMCGLIALADAVSSGGFCFLIQAEPLPLPQRIANQQSCRPWKNRSRRLHFVPQNTVPES